VFKTFLHANSRDVSTQGRIQSKIFCRCEIVVLRWTRKRQDSSLERNILLNESSAAGFRHVLVDESSKADSESFSLSTWWRALLCSVDFLKQKDQKARRLLDLSMLHLREGDMWIHVG